ncbi:MAG: DUF58 domain-containing protein [Thermoplasmata archaeon]|nr:DUF58 domain-containing protein [Thermoplasmata archaeon]
MWTRKTALLSAAVFSAALGGLIFEDYQLLVIGIIFALILSIAFITTQSRIEIIRMLPEPKTFEGDRIVVHLRIINKGRSLGLLEIFDKIPTTMRIADGSNKIVVNLRPNEVVDLTYIIECPLRGYYLLGPILLRKRDFFSIFCETQTIQNRSYLTVYPRMEEVKQLPMSSKYRKMHPGSLLMKRIGYGTEFHSIRDYVSTDPFKKINWKATAKYQKLMVNQFELEDVFDAMIFVDARDITKTGTVLRNPLEFSVKAAATLTKSFMRRTNRVGLVTYGSKVRVIRPGAGEMQMTTIISTLTGTYASGNTTLKSAVKTAMPYLTPRSPIVIISPLDEDDTVNEIIRSLTAQNYDITVISPSSIEFEREATGLYSPRYLMIKLERENSIAELTKYDVRVIDWTPDIPVSEVVRGVR